MLIQQDNIIDEEIGAMPPGPEEKPVQKPFVKKKTSAKPAVELQPEEQIQAEEVNIDKAQNNKLEKDEKNPPKIYNYVIPPKDLDF